LNPDLPAVILAAFPELESDNAEVLLPEDPRFNCVAWVAGVTDAVWWPNDPDAY
jgi:hypothetical protein